MTRKYSFLPWYTVHENKTNFSSLVAKQYDPHDPLSSITKKAQEETFCRHNEASHVQREPISRALI